MIFHGGSAFSTNGTSARLELVTNGLQRFPLTVVFSRSLRTAESGKYQQQQQQNWWIKSNKISDTWRTSAGNWIRSGGPGKAVGSDKKDQQSNHRTMKKDPSEA